MSLSPETRWWAERRAPGGHLDDSRLAEVDDSFEGGDSTFQGAGGPAYDGGRESDTGSYISRSDASVRSGGHRYPSAASVHRGNLLQRLMAAGLMANLSVVGADGKLKSAEGVGYDANKGTLDVGKNLKSLTNLNAEDEEPESKGSRLGGRSRIRSGAGRDSEAGGGRSASTPSSASRSLAYSRKPRATGYKPYNLQDFQRSQEREKAMLSELASPVSGINGSFSMMSQQYRSSTRTSAVSQASAYSAAAGMGYGASLMTPAARNQAAELRSRSSVDRRASNGFSSGGYYDDGPSSRSPDQQRRSFASGSPTLLLPPGASSGSSSPPMRKAASASMVRSLSDAGDPYDKRRASTDYSGTGGGAGVTDTYAETAPPPPIIAEVMSSGEDALTGSGAGSNPKHFRFPGPPSAKPRVRPAPPPPQQSATSPTKPAWAQYRPVLDDVSGGSSSLPPPPLHDLLSPTEGSHLHTGGRRQEAASGALKPLPVSPPLSSPAVGASASGAVVESFGESSSPAKRRINRVLPPPSSTSASATTSESSSLGALLASNAMISMPPEGSLASQAGGGNGDGQALARAVGNVRRPSNGATAGGGGMTMTPLDKPLDDDGGGFGGATFSMSAGSSPPQQKPADYFNVSKPRIARSLVQAGEGVAGASASAPGSSPPQRPQKAMAWVVS